MTDADINETMLVARLCALLILENGGETYRAEESVSRICKALGFADTEVIALPTGVFITVSHDGHNAMTSIKRIHKRGVNLWAINAVNSVARRLVGGRMTPSQARAELETIRTAPPQNKTLSVLAAGLSSGCFALLFHGSAFDFCVATFCGMVVQLMANIIKIEDMFNFTISFLGGFMIAVLSVLAVKLTGTGNLDRIITGAMMPLLPGIPMTNAIRDTMRGDLLSGAARGTEALLTAAAIAFGVGMVLKLYLRFLA